jgi:short subunit dehydrogenase-like uncharacterized protein
MIGRTTLQDQEKAPGQKRRSGLGFYALRLAARGMAYPCLSGGEVSMASGEPEVDVVLYGASGYTGRLTAKRLEQEGVSFIISGRDEAKLKGLARSLATSPQVVAVDIEDADGLRSLASRGKVLVSTAGPYTQLGPPLVEAAIQARRHFLDITGEQAYMRWVLDQEPRARQAGISIINAMGVDVIPGDVAAKIATAAMEDPQRLDIAYWTPALPSRGTLTSMAAHTGQGGWYDHGVYRNAPPGAFRHTFRYPQPHGERQGIFIPWGDVMTAPRSTGAKQVRTYFIAKPGTVSRMHTFRGLIAVSWKTGLTRFLLRSRLRTYKDPDRPRQEKVPWRVLAEATDKDGTKQRGYIEGVDPYGFTAAAVAHAAALLARGHQTDPGVLTPTQAFTFGPFLAGLEEFQIEIKGKSI